MFVNAILLIIFSVGCVRCTGITVVGIYNCDVPKNGLNEGLKVDLDIEHNAANIDATLPFDIDDTIEYSLTGSKYEKNKWVKDNMKMSGNFCDAISLYFPEAWEKLAKKMGVKADCPIPKGKYKVDGYTIASNEMIFKPANKGHYLLEITYYKKDVPLLCKQFELRAE